jgi:hypothetical protein
LTRKTLAIGLVMVVALVIVMEKTPDFGLVIVVALVFAALVLVLLDAVVVV